LSSSGKKKLFLPRKKSLRKCIWSKNK